MIAVSLGCLAVVVGSGLRASPPNALDFYGSLDHQPIAGVPAGSYGEWTEDQKIAATKLIKLSCVRLSFAGMMALAQEKASDAQKNEELVTLVAACVAIHLPLDHPAKKEYQDAAAKHYDAAKALGSIFPPPVL